MLFYLAAGAAFVLLVRRGDGPYVLAGALAADWLNGGFIGIHGTNQPEIVPGRVSQGCVRMRTRRSCAGRS
jgi:lipoprotein-anchoring transpeptidase ErfK/SrfK